MFTITTEAKKMLHVFIMNTVHLILTLNVNQLSLWMCSLCLYTLIPLMMTNK
jgi:hypothetical protein